MIWICFKSDNRDLMRIEPKAVGLWALFLTVKCTLGYLAMTLLGDPAHLAHAFDAVKWISPATTLTVFWEDAAHTLPLLLLMRLIGTKWYTWPVHALCLLIVMIAFGSGHTYQGMQAAVMLSFYIPFGVWMGNKKGLGTVMCCHVLWDLSTILMIQAVLKAIS